MTLFGYMANSEATTKLLLSLSSSARLSAGKVTNHEERLCFVGGTAELRTLVGFRPFLGHSLYWISHTWQCLEYAKREIMVFVGIGLGWDT